MAITLNGVYVEQALTSYLTNHMEAKHMETVGQTITGIFTQRTRIRSGKSVMSCATSGAVFLVLT